jgi:hypothetical protein
MEPTDDVEAVRATYKRLAKELHPDVQHGARRAVMVRDMRLVNQARDVLVAASQRGSLLVAAGHERRPPSAQAVDDLWHQAAPAWSAPQAPPPFSRWDPRARRADRSRRAAMRWWAVAAGLAVAVLVLSVLRVPQLDQALAPPLSSEDAAVIASGATDDRFTLWLLFGALQLLYPVCFVKWCMWARRSLGAGRRGRGALTMALVAVLVALYWGFAPEARHRDALFAGGITAQGYTDAMAWENVLATLKALPVLVLAAVALFALRRPPRAAATA